MNRHGRRHYEDNRKRGAVRRMDLAGIRKTGGLVIQKEDMMTLINHGYLLPLRADYPGADVLPVFNQADTRRKQRWRRMLDCMGETSGIACGHLDKDGSARVILKDG